MLIGASGLIGYQAAISQAKPTLRGASQAGVMAYHQDRQSVPVQLL